MSEPTTAARKLNRVIPTVLRWNVADDRHDGWDASAYAVVELGRMVLIDPLPIAEDVLRRAGEIEAIILTCADHQRSAWRFRKLFGCHVWAPDGAEGLEEQPDQRYTAGDTLPGRLTPYHTPGPTPNDHALWIDHPRSTLFLGDLVWNDGSGTPRFLSQENQEQPERTRASIRRILDHLPVEVLCFGHGPPILVNGRAALERALAEDHEALPNPPPG